MMYVGFRKRFHSFETLGEGLDPELTSLIGSLVEFEDSIYLPGGIIPFIKFTYEIT